VARARHKQVDAWNRVLVAGAAAGASGGLTKEGFLTRWRVITLEDPRTAFEQVRRGRSRCCSAAAGVLPCVCALPQRVRAVPAVRGCCAHTRVRALHALPAQHLPPPTTQAQMLYLGMGGRCGEEADALFTTKPRRRKGDRKTGELADRCGARRAATRAPGSGSRSGARACIQGL
jgi:hypothetical protein